MYSTIGTWKKINKKKNQRLIIFISNFIFFFNLMYVVLL